jgi:glycosyltransferase involved in cell wall biosynthesis
MKILWICGLPNEVQNDVLQGQNYGAHADWSWILGHLPPPEDVELHIACRTARHTQYREFTYAGAHFHLIPVKSRARALCLFRFDWIYFRKLMPRIKPDVVHGWGMEDAYANVAIKLSPERHVVEVQGNLNAYRKRVKMSWLIRWTALNERQMLARARHVAAENEYSLGSAMGMIRTKSVHAIEHPIRPVFLTAPPSDGMARQILFLGAIEERKGIGDALEVFRNGAPKDWTMAIVGNGGAEQVARMREEISKSDLSGRVVHHAQLNTSEIVSVMQSSSVFLLPTRIDTGPTALKEALAMGLWPVCYDNSGPGHYIKKFQYGNVAEDLNLAALMEVLRRAIAAQEWKCAVNQAKVKSHIRPHFDRARIWRELINLYRQISQP